MRRALFFLAAVRAAHGQEGSKDEVDAAYVAWAGQVVDAVRKADTERTLDLVDFAAVVRAGTTGGPEDLREKFLGDMTVALHVRGGVLYQVIESVSTGAHFGLLRVLVRDGSPCARFRLASLDGGINYFDLKMERDARGKVRGVDMYGHTTGEWMSASTGRLFLPYVRDQRKSAFEKLLVGREEWVNGIQRIKEIVDLERAGHPDKALEEFARLPDVVRRSKECMVIRVRIAGQVDEKKLEEAIREYMVAYPNDPGSQLVAMTGHLVAGRNEQALSCVDALDKLVGGDPYLDIFRAYLHLRSGKLDKVRPLARAALEKDPDWEDAYWVLLDVALREKKFGEVARLLNAVQGRFGYDLSGVDEAPEYSEFVESPEYKAWVEEFKKR